ncbi:DUF4132 domain-containing protein [Actinoplanes derwentensis]|uniref:DUF4132 domain-containing protein n=1 Tax=Actinoplanes derwentensis TaxID=113562 RepID=A0A1H1RKT2_9ACTN|nr:DUF4132 domain-containing protein [Actinoplanes derwentensis]GID84452.1 hypothetical protein Ade03nite_33760 [Actinoplanes derwentensis]SDS36315.1 protein of unknown function [Actinoplanes derwentensis]
MEDTGNLTSPEDTFVLPEAWRKHLHPRRGGAGVRPFVADPKARARVEQMLAARPATVDVVTPAAAAVVAASAARGRDDRVALADVWITDHGLRFAALAAVETASLQIIAGLPLLLRVRAALASAPEEEFEQVVAALTPYRAGSAFARAACSVLTVHPDWLAEDVADALSTGDSTRTDMLLYAVDTPAQADQLARQAHFEHWGADHDLVVTFADGAGAAAGPGLLHWLDAIWGTDQCILAMLAALPGDDAMRGLLARSGSRGVRSALRESAERFPARAMRLLAEANDELLRVHVVKHLDLVDQVLPLLSPAAAGRVRAVVEASADVVTAPPSAVPPVLAEPPWQNRKKAAKPPVVAGLTCTDEAAADWLAGEREEWAETARSHYVAPEIGWPALAEKVINGTSQWYEAGQLFTQGPEEVAREAFARWRPRTDYMAPHWMRGAAGRLGTDVLPVLLTFARATPGDYGPLLMPFTSPEVALLMADWSARLKSVRRLAQRWLTRHPEAAARALIPAALGKAGTARRQAERALLLLHGSGHTEQVRVAATGYGPEAAAGVEALFAADPLAALPTRMPPPPGWAAPGVLPPVRLRDGSGALPAEAVTNLVLMLMISRPDEPYAGLDLVRDAVDPAGLAGFGWALFQLWQTAGGNSKESWVFDAVTQTGDDETVRRFTPLVLAWPSEGLPARAITGLSVLVGIGSDQALLHLHRISQRARSTTLRKAAAARIAEVAEGLGLTAEQLADRLVPDFGLDADGSLRLDYGPRQFVVGFDEQLRPFVAEAGGKRLKALPKPGVRDDTELGEEAYRRFAALKKDVRKISAEQVRRLEQAMIDGRRWTGAEFRRLFVDHPLMWHIGRRLVWARFEATEEATGEATGDAARDGGGAVAGSLRIAEDRSFADADDEPVELGDDDLVGVAHPVHLGAEGARWAEVFTDYEILQPFPQLGRPVFTLTEAERGAGRLDRFEGVTVATTKVLLLDRRGWVRQEAAYAGTSPGFDRPAGRGQVLTVHLDPGIVGQVGFYDQQKLVAVFLHDGTVSGWSLDDRDLRTLGGLDPVMASEILRDLTDVTE